MKNSLIILCFALLLTACDQTETTKSTQNTTIVQAQDIVWQQLNPARGDKSPQAGTLWGNRTGAGAAGFILKPTDGFESPPHIHNVAYRGVVISGLLHNDDPTAANMWMPQGSFWTQPAGEVHITAAKGSNSLAYIEVEDEFKVLPAEQAFDNGERPVNVDESNIIWLNAKDIKWVDSVNTIQMAFLWGKPQNNELNGTFVKMPTAYNSTIESNSDVFHAVIVQGNVNYNDAPSAKVIPLQPASYFNSNGNAKHALSCEGSQECIVYIRTKGRYGILK